MADTSDRDDRHRRHVLAKVAHLAAADGGAPVKRVGAGNFHWLNQLVEEGLLWGGGTAPHERRYVGLTEAGARLARCPPTHPHHRGDHPVTITDPTPLPAYLAARSAPDALEIDQEAALAGAVAQLEAWAQGTDRAEETALERIERLLADDVDEEAGRAFLVGVSAEVHRLVEIEEWTATPEEEEPALVEATADRLRDQIRSAWRVENDGQARWADTRLRAIRATIEGHQADAAAWRAEIDTWLAEVLAPHRRREAFFYGSLTDYMRRLREADPQKASHKLPGGTVLTSRRAGEAVVIPEDETSEATVIAWAREHLKGDELADVVKVVESVRVSKLRAHVKVADETIGQQLVIELDCGHVVVVPAPDDLDDESMADAQPIDRWPCEECEPIRNDPDGYDVPNRGVVGVTRRPVTVKVARSIDTGQPVPGATVRPASITYDVKLP